VLVTRSTVRFRPAGDLMRIISEGIGTSTQCLGVSDPNRAIGAEPVPITTTLQEQPKCNTSRFSCQGTAIAVATAPERVTHRSSRTWEIS